MLPKSHNKRVFVQLYRKYNYQISLINRYPCIHVEHMLNTYLIPLPWCPVQDGYCKYLEESMLHEGGCYGFLDAFIPLWVFLEWRNLLNVFQYISHKQIKHGDLQKKKVAVDICTVPVPQFIKLWTTNIASSKWTILWELLLPACFSHHFRLVGRRW